MAVPNTTPTPNELYNGEMKKMGDTELRLVLVVTRKTLGWEENKETGMRKKEDWINKTQLMKLTGRKSAAISKAIDRCIKNGWIEARNKDGDLLDTKDKRKRLGYAGKVFYRLGKIFLNNTTAIQKANSRKRTAESEQEQKKPITKETLLQNNTLKGITKQSYGDPNINLLISYLKEKLKLPMLDGSVKQNRYYCNLGIKKFDGVDKMKLLIDAVSRDDFWATKIASFQQLYYKGVQIISKTRKKGGENGRSKIAFINPK